MRPQDRDIAFYLHQPCFKRLKNSFFFLSRFGPFVQLLYTPPVRLSMVYRNSVIVDRSPQAVDPTGRLEKTIDSQPESPASPPSQAQKCNIQEINGDSLSRQTHKLYHFENCGIVYVDSFNTHGVRMENCGNTQVTCSFFFSFFSPFSSNQAILVDHRLGNERGLHLQSHAVSDGMWALQVAPSAIKHVEYAPLDGPQNATDPPIADSEIAKGNPINVHLQTDAPSLPQSPLPSFPSHSSGDHTHHNIKHLEQLLDSSLATVAVIHFSGLTLADVLTPRAYDTFKALYALADLDAPTSTRSTNRRGSEIPTRSTFSDIGNDYLYSSNRLPPMSNSNFAVPRTYLCGLCHTFLWAGLAVVPCLVVFFNFPPLCERIFRM